MGYKTGFYNSKKNNKKIRYRSSYELRAYKILEKDWQVESYEAEPIKIPYWYRGRKTYTKPDLLITYNDGQKELIEIKPQYRLNYEHEKIKFEIMRAYARQQNWKFLIWTESDLWL